MSTPIALTTGVTPKRREAVVRTGNGDVPMPDVKTDVTKSSKLSTKQSRLDAAIDGQTSGSTTSRSAPRRVAPRSIALSSSSGFRLTRRLRTTTVTKGRQTAMWARTIVVLESVRPSFVNSRSDATAVTVSGETRRSRMVASVGPATLREPRTSPSASSGPLTAQAAVVSSAISIEVRSDACQSSEVSASRYQRVLKPLKRTSDSPLLNE